VVRAGLVSLCAVSLLIAGCGGSSEAPAAELEPASAGAADTGTMVASYEDATTPEAVNGRTIYQDHKALEDMADGVNELLKLPFDIPLVGAECDQANAFWDREDKQMVICYEMADFAASQFEEVGDPDPVDSAVNASYAIFFHEMGHMVIDLYDLPITGREEDVADQLAAFMLLQPDDQGQLDPESVEVLLDDARLFAIFSGDGQVDESDFADEHSLSQARMYNMLCWAVGADPDMNGHLVDDGFLPEERAVQCDGEFNRMNQAWATLLAPHVKD
jgi:hypothetical protein